MAASKAEKATEYQIERKHCTKRNGNFYATIVFEPGAYGTYKLTFDREVLSAYKNSRFYLSLEDSHRKNSKTRMKATLRSFRNHIRVRVYKVSLEEWKLARKKELEKVRQGAIKVTKIHLTRERCTERDGKLYTTINVASGFYWITFDPVVRSKWRRKKLDLILQDISGKKFTHEVFRRGLGIMVLISEAGKKNNFCTKRCSI